MDEAGNKFKTYLKSKGLRFTQERRLILEEIVRMQNHFEPEDLAMKLRRKGSRVSRTSVYRTLPLLLESGMVRKTPCDRIRGRYEYVFGHSHHDHLLCLGCGRIVEFISGSIEGLRDGIGREFNFRPTGHRLVISGFCEDCDRDE